MASQSFFDQLNNEVSFQYPPARIVSLVPSQTELLADLGLDQEVIGITRYCVHPPSWLKTKTIVGGTKNFDFEIIDQLRPDLIIGNKEENYAEGILHLKKKYAVWMSDIVSLHDAYSMINSVGGMTGRKERAAAIANEIASELKNISKQSGQSVLYLIWRKPWMAAGSETFVDSMLAHLNLKNVMEKIRRYPALTEEQIQRVKPEFIFLSSEPFPFTEKHIDELKAICPNSKIMLVDGEMFSWYGSRLIQASRYLNNLRLD